MDSWPHKVEYVCVDSMQVAVRQANWQSFRSSLKGLPTSEKLRRLEGWLLRKTGGQHTKVQVDNYINALKRGGQLSMDLRVQR